MTYEERQELRLAIDRVKRERLARASQVTASEGRNRERRRASWRAYAQRKRAAA